MLSIGQVCHQLTPFDVIENELMFIDAYLLI